MLLAQIQSSAEIAEQMIYGIHDLAHLAQNVRTDTITSLADLIRVTITGTELNLAQLKGDAELISDARLLRQIALRLCANVADHSGSDQLRIHIESDAAAVLCHFEDQGAGLSDPEWEQALKPFNRCGKRPTADHVGLGLTLSAQGAHSLGGTLTGKRLGHHGYRVTLSIPHGSTDENE